MNICIKNCNISYRYTDQFIHKTMAILGYARRTTLVHQWSNTASQIALAIPEGQSSEVVKNHSTSHLAMEYPQLYMFFFCSATHSGLCHQVRFQLDAHPVAPKFQFHQVIVSCNVSPKGIFCHCHWRHTENYGRWFEFFTSLYLPSGTLT